MDRHPRKIQISKLKNGSHDPKQMTKIREVAEDTQLK